MLIAHRRISGGALSPAWTHSGRDSRASLPEAKAPLAWRRGARFNERVTAKESVMCYREDWYEWEAARRRARKRVEQERKTESVKPAAAPADSPKEEPETRKPKEVETEPELV